MLTQSPVIQAEEQLVLIVSEPMKWEGLFKGHQPRTWNGSIEIERKEYQTYAEVLTHVYDASQIRRALRVCMSTGAIVDITVELLDAAKFEVAA